MAWQLYQCMKDRFWFWIAGGSPFEVFEQLQKSLRMANTTVLHVSMQSGSEKQVTPFPKYPFLHWQEYVKAPLNSTPVSTHSAFASHNSGQVRQSKSKKHIYIHICQIFNVIEFSGIIFC